MITMMMNTQMTMMVYLCLIFLMLASSLTTTMTVQAAAAGATAGEDNNNNNNDDDEMVDVMIGFHSLADKVAFIENQMLPSPTSGNGNGGGLRGSSSAGLGGGNNRPFFQPKLKKMIPFRRANKSLAVTLSKADLETLQQQQRDSTNIDFIDLDAIVTKYNDDVDHYYNEEVPYGILDVLQAESWSDIYNISTKIPMPPPLVSQQDIDDGDCFRVCVVDDGLFVNHPDLPFDFLGDIEDSEDAPSNSRLTGSQFSLPEGEYWYNPDPETSGHGTHVTGTIFAEGNNNEGVVGVISNPQGMCLSMARVFRDGSPSTSVSTINRAVEWCANQPGTRVINLSLGTESSDSTSEEIYRELYESENILVFAAAGNGGSSEYSYPASYDNVISVAAVDSDLQHARFSQTNDQVSISGPGVSILSFGRGGLAMILGGDDGSEDDDESGDGTSDNTDILPEFTLIPDFIRRYHQFSKTIDVDDDDFIGESLEVVDCGSGFDECDDVEDKICLIERGVSTFAEKAKNCEDGDGIMAFIYNNVDGTYGGSLTEEGGEDIDIPVIALTREEGLTLLNATRARTTTVVADGEDEDGENDGEDGEEESEEDGDGDGERRRVFIRIEEREFGYTSLSGTSMASPHVAGVAAKIWAARPQCTNQQVEEALLQTAMKLGNGDNGDDEDGEEEETGETGETQDSDASEDERRRDDVYGFGFVQAVDAYEYLLSNFEEPCGMAPSAAPSEVPSEVPSATPSEEPSATPTPFPSNTQSPGNGRFFRPPR